MANKDYKKQDLPADELPSITDSVLLPTTAPAEPELLVSFDRWFSTTGKPDHWKTGMKAFANTSGKKSLAAWAKLFETY